MKYGYILQSIQQTGDDIAIVSLRPQNGQRPISFEPGQYATIGFEVDGRKTPMRCFSMTNAPEDTTLLQFGMKVQGDFTRMVTGLSPGDRAEISGPFGSMTVNPRRDKVLVLIAGGVGITPFMSIIRHAAANRSTRPIRLLYANRSNNIPYFNELAQLQRDHPPFKAVYFSEAVAGQAGENIVAGRITAEQIKAVVGDHHNDVTYMICGPKGMTVAIQKILKEWGISKRQVLVESFSQETAFAWPKFGTAPATTYALSIAGLLVIGGIVMFSDLQKASAKLAQSKAATKQVQQSTSSTTTSTTATTPVTTETETEPDDDTTAQPSPTTTTPSQPAATPTQTPTPTPAPTPVYTAPVQTNDPPRGGAS